VISGTVKFHDGLKGLMADIDEVIPHAENPNNGDVEAIIKSIESNGYAVPVIASKTTGEILAGNHRYFALKQMGSEVIPVVWVDMDTVEGIRFLLDDNHTARLGHDDPGQLLKLLNILNEQQVLDTSSYDPHDLEQLQTIIDMTPDYSDHASWPTISLTVPPHIKNAFYRFTEQAMTDHERLEMLLRLAGWGKED
jgi:hypothetical protein